MLFIKSKLLVCFVVSSQSSLELAGVRIRYQRLAKAFQEKDLSIEIRVLEELIKEKKLEYNVYVLSKVYCTKALLFAKRIACSRKKLALDLYDDYFSHYKDPRFYYYQQWLIEALKLSDFVFCSTDRMREVVRDYNQEIRTGILHDLLPNYDKESLKKLLIKKTVELDKSKHLKLIWFGVGDNPNFSLGLKDLQAFSHQLFAFSYLDMDVELQILTNERSLTHENLKGLNHIPIHYSIDIWNIDNEKSFLESAFLCFLPINGQNFCIAKTLNRATTGLLSGCQILSCGFPLYKTLNKYIYRDSLEFIKNLDTGLFQHNHMKLDDLFNTFQHCGEAKIESSNFRRIIKELVSL